MTIAVKTAATVAMEKVEKKLFHYTKKAIADFNMLDAADRVLVCLSGGKDSFTMLAMLRRYQSRMRKKFDLFVFILNQSQPGWSDENLRNYLEQENIPYEIRTRNVYGTVKEKVSPNDTYCGLCSRLRRGNIYDYASRHGYNKIALGHHRDDLIQTLLMSILYNGQVCSMPPKLLTDNKKHIVIRPLVYCQEQDIIRYVQYKKFPTTTCDVCGMQQNLARKKIAKLIAELAKENPKIPSNILHAIANINPSQMMDHKLWNFKELQTL